MNTITIKDENGITKTYTEVPSTIQDVTKCDKPQTKYRKNGALVFAPELDSKYWVIDPSGFEGSSQTWDDCFVDRACLQQGLVFDSKEKAQLWADKLKIAYALKQRIVEAESEVAEDTLYHGRIWFEENIKDFDFQSSIGEGMLKVPHVAFDILMSDNVSNEHFQYYIEVFSL